MLTVSCLLYSFSLPKKYGRPSKTSSVASDAAANVELGPRRQQRLKRQSSLSDSQTNASTLTSEQMTSSAPSAESEMDPLSPKPVFASASASLTSLHPQATEPTANSQPGMEQHSTNSALLDASASSTFLGQGLFQQRVFAQSPPPIGQQSFRNVRERAESVASDGHSFSSRSSSSNSLQPSRAHSGDGSQLYFDALSPAHSASEQSGSFQNSPIVATSSFAFSDLPWQQTAVTTAASWSRGSVSSVDIAAVPATTTTAASLGPLLESQASIEFDSLLNSFDATMFTAGGSDLGITAEMGLGLLPGFTGAQPAMTSQAYNDVDLSDTSLTQTLALSNQQGFGGDQKDSSPETPAASRSSLTSAILPGSSARAPGMNTAWQGQWTFDAHQRPQLVPTSQPTNTSVPLGGLGASPRTTSQALAGSLADLAAQSLGLTLDVTTPMMMFQGGPAAAPQVQRSQTAADIRWDQQQQYLQSSPQGLQGQQQQQQQQQQQYQVLLQEQQAQQQRAQQQHSYPFLDGNSWPYGPALQHNSNAELDRPAMQAASRAASAPSVIATDAFTAPSQQQQQAFASPSQRSRQQELDRLRQQWRSTYSTMFPNQPSS
ncbi:hypothetical protein OC845_003902 [Tilletia horrida]|nr:hypothetical protein OC845_003902 [Tilletia horrida]